MQSATNPLDDSEACGSAHATLGGRVYHPFLALGDEVTSQDMGVSSQTATSTGGPDVSVATNPSRVSANVTVVPADQAPLSSDAGVVEVTDRVGGSFHLARVAEPKSAGFVPPPTKGANLWWLLELVWAWLITLCMSRPHLINLGVGQAQTNRGPEAVGLKDATTAGVFLFQRALTESEAAALAAEIRRVVGRRLVVLSHIWFVLDSPGVTAPIWRRGAQRRLRREFDGCCGLADSLIGVGSVFLFLCSQGRHLCLTTLVQGAANGMLSSDITHGVDGMAFGHLVALLVKDLFGYAGSSFCDAMSERALAGDGLYSLDLWLRAYVLGRLSTVRMSGHVTFGGRLILAPPGVARSDQLNWLVRLLQLWSVPGCNWLLVGAGAGSFRGGEDSAGVDSGWTPTNTSGAGVKDAADLANCVPLATLYHAAAVLLQSDNCANHFGPGLFEGESQWAGKDLRIGTARDGTRGEFGRESIVRDMEFRTKTFNGTLTSDRREWGLVGACDFTHPIRCYDGEPAYTTPLGAVRLEGWDLLRADSPGKSAKAVVAHAANYRFITDTNLRAMVWPIIDASVYGGSYTRWWLKFWLDWFGKMQEAAYAKAGHSVVTSGPNPLPAVLELTNLAANADTTFVDSNLDAVMIGDVFLCDTSMPAHRDPVYLGFIRNYAAAWPRTTRSVAGSPDIPFVCDQIVIPGASTCAWLNGSRGNAGAGALPGNISPTHLLGLARVFMQQTGSQDDCMAGLELAASMVLADPYGNTMPSVHCAAERNPCVRNLGRDLEVGVPPDNTLRAYLAPYYTNEVTTHVAHDVLTMRVSVLGQMIVYYHTTLSQAHAAARLVMSTTCDMLEQGVGNTHIQTMTAKEGAARHISKFDRLVGNVCAHMFGYMPRTLTLMNGSLSSEALAIQTRKAIGYTFHQQWIPQQWLGYEICEVMLMMPEGWALTGPGARMQLDVTKGSPCKDRVRSANFVRLFRSLPVLEDYQWLGDGGQAHGAAHVASGHGPHYRLQNRAWWPKPYLSERPAAPVNVPLLWVDQTMLPGVLVPGQFPVWDDANERAIAWGLGLAPTRPSAELMQVLNREPDITTTRVFTARNGFLADDPTRVRRALPNLRLYDVFSEGSEPGTPVTTVERMLGGHDLQVGPELIAEANSMSEDVAGPPNSSARPGARGGGSRAGGGARGHSARGPGWATVPARGGRKQVRVINRVAFGGGAPGDLGANRFAALTSSVDSAADASARARALERAAAPSTSAADATPKLQRLTQSAGRIERGPSDEELIDSAVAAAQKERERMQSVGVGAAPPRASYSEVVSRRSADMRQMDRASAPVARVPTGREAVEHPPVGHAERVVDGKPVAVPDTYVAPPSQSSTNVLEALNVATAHRRLKDGSGRPEN